MAVRIYYHPSSREHHTPPGHPECPARLDAVLNALRSHELPDVVEWGEPQPADPGLLRKVHAAAYLEGLKARAQRGGGRLDADTIVSEGSYEAAIYAAGSAVAAADCALSGTNSFAAVRPPGHHATAVRAMGFCLINNVAVAARWAIEDRGLDRVLIIDWDVHHGNGTQALVEHEPRVRYVSLHQWPLYPGTGRAEERGVGNITNVPLPPGLPRETYTNALIEGVSQAVDTWVPQLILISAGFDAMAGDPLGGFTLEPADYAQWVERWRELGAPVASVLEGGYLPDRLAAGAVAHVGALA
ncbi:MAG: histone deacetylase family protein [Gemmatimonadales bacterium]